jgi:hypothetical protein
METKNIIKHEKDVGELAHAVKAGKSKVKGKQKIGKLEEHQTIQLSQYVKLILNPADEEEKETATGTGMGKKFTLNH